jgi:hypothetical protein
LHSRSRLQLLPRNSHVSYPAIEFLHQGNLKNKVPLVSLNPSRFPAGWADMIMTVQTDIVLLGVLALEKNAEKFIGVVLSCSMQLPHFMVYE